MSYRKNNHGLFKAAEGFVNQFRQDRAEREKAERAEIKIGSPFQSGYRTVRHDEVWYRGVHIGTIQYINGNADKTISVVAGVRDGEQIKWLIEAAERGELFTSAEERNQWLSFNESGRGVPAEKRLAQQRKSA